MDLLSVSMETTSTNLYSDDEEQPIIIGLIGHIVIMKSKKMDYENM